MPSIANVRIGRVRTIAATLAACAGGSACAGDLVFLGDFEDGTTISWLRQHVDLASGAAFVLEPAIVTAVKLTNSNTKLTLFLQVPGPGPAWSAIEALGDTAGEAPATGDCVRARGTLVEFKGTTELSPMTWAAAAALDCGNGSILPFNVSVNDIATDTSSASAGNQPGSLAEAYESALLRVTNVSESTAPSGGVFDVYDSLGSSTPYLAVADVLYHYNGVVGTHFSAVTGVLQEFDSLTDPVYQLLPRSASDVVVGP